MGNSYFKFKEFAIEQDKCAMKVSTDACIQGAWTPVNAHLKQVLDIGAGTGLLSLMLAQRSQGVLIDAIEYDKDAALQATDNINSSPWAKRIDVINIDANEYDSVKKYDLIISNPPFFDNSLLGDAEQRNRARHTITLNYQQLFSIMRTNIMHNGLASVMLPVDTFDTWQAIITDNKWSICNKLYIHPNGTKKPNRIVAICSPIPNQSVLCEEHLFIRSDAGEYTDEYKELMFSFYL